MAEAQTDTQNAEVESAEIWIPPPLGTKKNKMEELLKIYDNLIDFLNQDDCDEDLKKALDLALSGDVSVGISSKNYDTKPKYLQVMELRKEDLRRMECGITITGDTSSGKTSLVNKLVGQRLVTPKVLRATSKICRIRNSETYAIEVLDVDGKVLKEKTTFNTPRKINKKLDTYTDTRDSNAGMYYIDIYCPFTNLDVKGNVMLVDTPGIDGAKDINAMLMEFLPNAFGFIFIIDASKAGGVDEDKLLAILRSINQATYKMPCFETDDVLFVINKWNTLHFRASSKSDDSSEDEDERISEDEIVWNEILTKLKAVWPTLTQDQIFRLNLLSENTADDTEKEKIQFRRFAEVLSQLLKKTKNRKVKMHMSLLFDTICVIERGIESRIHVATADNENMVSALQDSHASLELLGKRCKEICVELDENIESSVDNLSKTLYDYLNSPQGKNEILNPSGEKPIKDCFFLVREVSLRFRKGVLQWIKGKDVVDEIEKIDRIAVEKFKELHLELERVQVSITGKELEKRTEALTLSAIILTIGLAPLHLDDILRNTKQRKIDAWYSTCVEYLTKEELRTIISNIFKDHFGQSITSIFETELPKGILSTMCTISYLSTEREKITNNLESSLRLRDSLYKIKGDIENVDL
ncbi:uncharacterized protein LOC125662713 [Ostrea edulis]|uniref:uncharacterized protein LOC125662713 n=1 Tax=Ostrea edulis TaxID=37623 RepID=UPI0024AF1EA9|nr:uncharacterized protein LOC125662713 [Ostrea edulis]XP_048750995.2 uncharacterized protein LOC125662713 [Ostrea edulis]